MTAQDSDIDLTAADVVGRLVARARRIADLSQRDLAARVGASPGTIARVESGAGLPSLQLFAAIMATAQLRVRIIGADDEDVRPIPVSTARDNAGRRFPAHLDVAPPDQIPSWATRGPRYDRQPPQAWYHQRAERDRLSARCVEVPRPHDHPTSEELAERRWQRIHARPGTGVAMPEIVCTCPDACYDDDDEVIGCLPDCPCQCEPPQR